MRKPVVFLRHVAIVAVALLAVRATAPHTQIFAASANTRAANAAANTFLQFYAGAGKSLQPAGFTVENATRHLLYVDCILCNMSEIIFLVEQAPEGGFSARALDVSIFTQAETTAELHARVRDAVRCHFDESDAPKMIRLHFVRDEVIAA